MRSFSHFGVVTSLLALVAMWGSAPIARAAESAGWTAPSNAAIHDLLVDRIDLAKASVGIVVGVIGPNGQRIVSYGQLDQGDPRPLNGDTEFEIGSITKVFTSLLLADMDRRGELSLNDPVAKFFPASVSFPTRNEKQITLLDIATQTSGLPRMPYNFLPAQIDNPYVDYTEDKLFAFLAHYKLPRDIGARFEYSNLAVGILGDALSRRAGMTYEALLRQRITGPLGMNDTGVSLTADMKHRLAVGHSDVLKAVSNWDLPMPFTGAGALRSTTRDLLRFLAVELGDDQSAIKQSMDMQLAVRRSIGREMDIALAWFIEPTAGGTVIWHNGGTGGYRTFLGFNPATRTGVVALSNAASDGVGVDDIGRYVLTGTGLRVTHEVAERIKANTSSPGTEAFLRRYIDAIQRGEPNYDEMAPGLAAVVRDEYPGLKGMYVNFGSLKSLTLAEVDANGGDLYEATFEHGKAHWVVWPLTPEGKASTVIFRPVPRPPQDRKEISLDGATKQAFVGDYLLTPNFDIAISMEGDRLFSQASGQQKFEVFPESADEVFLKIVDAQISFVMGADGHADSIVLHQNGRDRVGKRITP